MHDDVARARGPAASAARRRAPCGRCVGSTPSGSRPGTPRRRANQAGDRLPQRRRPVGQRVAGRVGRGRQRLAHDRRASGRPACPPTGRRCRPGGPGRGRRTARAVPGEVGQRDGRAAPAPGTAGRAPSSLVVLLRGQRRDQRVVLGDQAQLGGAAGRPEVVEELDVGLVVVGPLLGDVVLVVDGLDRADRLAGTAVDALVGVDVERSARPRRCSRPGIPRCRPCPSGPRTAGR